MAGHGEDCFGVKLSLNILGIMNSTDRREEKRNFLIQGRRFRRSFKNYCDYRHFMKLSRLLSIVKLGIDVLLSEHLQSRCIDSSMYRYTPTCVLQRIYYWFYTFLNRLQSPRKVVSRTPLMNSELESCLWLTWQDQRELHKLRFANDFFDVCFAVFVIKYIFRIIFCFHFVK